MSGTNSCTTGAKDNKEETIVKKLIQLINEAKLTPLQLGNVIPEFLFSVGISIEGCDDSLTSEDVLIKYAKTPTLGNALMAQALWMRDTWKESTQGKETNND